VSRARAWALLAGILLVGGWLRLGALGADLPVEIGMTYAPVQDAAWYAETAARRVEGVPPEPEATPWDVALWTHLAATWFRAWGGAGPAALHALGGLLSLATVLALWRFLLPLGRSTALAGAAALAVLYPTVLLARSGLVYGPAALYLLTCAALWRLGRGRSAQARIACELGAWALLLLGCWALRPPLAALGAGLFAAHVARSAHPRRWLIAGVVLAVLGGVALLSLSALRAFPAIDQLAYRLEWHGFSVGPRRLIGDALRVAGEPNRGGSGFARLALVPLVAAAWGWTLAVLRGPRLSPAARETVALLGGWVAGLYLASLPFGSRPLRYWALIGPPLAGLVGVGLTWPRRARPLSRLELLALALPAAAVGAHALGVLVEWAGFLEPGLESGQPAPWIDPLPQVGALLGAGLCVLLATLPPSERGARLRPLLLAVVLGLPLVRSAALPLAPTDWTLQARGAVAELLADGAVLAGPYAPVLLQGTGRARRLGYTLNTGTFPDGTPRLPAGLAWAREAGVTHLALDLGQERSSQLIAHCAREGVELEVVALLSVGGPPDHDVRRRHVRGAQVLLLRFPWCAGLSPVEGGAAPQRHSTWLALAGGRCAAGKADEAWSWRQRCPPEIVPELDATIRRTSPLPWFSQRKY